VRKEYGQRGLAVLEGRPNGLPPVKGLSRRSARRLARHLGIASATVNRILRENQLQPHRFVDAIFADDDSSPFAAKHLPLLTAIKTLFFDSTADELNSFAVYGLPKMGFGTPINGFYRNSGEAR
jgi:hypothetical protein